MTEQLPPFEAELWEWTGQAPARWFFVTLPPEPAEAVGLHAFLLPKRGWRSVRVRAQSGSVIWDTSLFPDKARDSWLLPVKAEVRRKLGVGAGDSIELVLTLRDQAMI
ncbi:MAG: DUF1905 domain-containing protein [Sphingomonas sp.]|nr:MAG: DUF1905 domain-containing protein [Sphingomonas sp.]